MLPCPDDGVYDGMITAPDAESFEYFMRYGMADEGRLRYCGQRNFHSDAPNHPCPQAFEPFQSFALAFRLDLLDVVVPRKS
eukprot:scaffold5529_cov117-Cylindrotheca_fusiformis.AAC.41